MPKTSLSDLMGNAAGPTAYVTASAAVALVRRTSKKCKLRFCISD